MQIRLAVREDVAAVMELLGRVISLMRATENLQWDESYPNAAVFAQDVERTQLWVAEIDGAFAGMAALTTDQTPEYVQVGWDIEEPAVVVHRPAVDPQFRGVGIASALMQKAEEAERSGTEIVFEDGL